jgi:hypothetical protein
LKQWKARDGGSIRTTRRWCAGWFLLLIYIAIIALVILLLPVFMLIGAVYGAFAAPSAEDVDQALAALKTAVLDLRPADTLRQQVARAARESGADVAPLADRGAAAGVDTILEIGPPP